jgi:hypothetical protein
MDDDDTTHYGSRDEERTPGRAARLADETVGD